MSPLRAFYLVLAIIGAILPYWYFVRWFREHGVDLGLMMEAWNVNDAATGLVYDLTVAWVALVVFVLAECWRRRDRLGLIAIPAGICIGVSCGLPLYLFLRSRPSMSGKS